MPSQPKPQKGRSRTTPSPAPPPPREFDLNIEKVLDGWEVCHALRELIANALDEQILSGTSDIYIIRDAAQTWRIRDFGRGLHHSHLTQNENPEKRARETEVIGRFGVGLKDALAVLDRRGIRVVLRSRHGDITLSHRPKAEFGDVTTLHARVAPPTDATMQGTEVCVSGVRERDIVDARRFFLRFSDETLLERTKYGQIYQRAADQPARIYVNGLAVATEPDFAFSYNVTSLTQAMRKALNRERTNVGRTAYTSRVKDMLLAAQSPAIAEALVTELQHMVTGHCHEEAKWADVALSACQFLNASRPVVFVTTRQLLDEKELVDRARTDGRTVVTVPDTIAAKLTTIVDTAGQPIQSLEQFAIEYTASVQYRFIAPTDLTAVERRHYNCWRDIAALGGGLPLAFRELKISETMRPSVHEGFSPGGHWEEATGRVIIKRSVLRSLPDFAGTLLHELTHARTGLDDVSRDFESALTGVIGDVAAAALSLQPPRTPAATKRGKPKRGR